MALRDKFRLLSVGLLLALMAGFAFAAVAARAAAPGKYTFDPVTVTGKLAVLKDDPTGVFYRILDAEPAN